MIRRLTDNAMMLLLAALIFVWPIAHTIALRYILAGILLLFFIVSVCQSQKWQCLKELGAGLLAVPSALILLLSFWLLVQALFVVPKAEWVWGELKGQWLKDVSFWFLGLGIGTVFSRKIELQRNSQFLTPRPAIVIGLSGIVLWNVVASIASWVMTGEFPIMHNVTGAKATDSYVNNMLLALVVSDLLQCRVNRNRPAQAFATATNLFLIAVCVLNTLFLGARNGWIALGMFIVSWVVIMYMTTQGRSLRKLISYGLILSLCLVFAAWTSWKTDVRWQTFTQTVPIAWDIDSNRFWLNGEKYPRPVTPSGDLVDSSNYDRIAWIHAGTRLIASNPLGGGFSRHAFGRELARVFPESTPQQGMHAHSGVIDFGIGVGIPGLVLWFAFVSTLIIYGGVAYFSYGSSAGLALVFMTSGFVGRSVLDGSMRDHMMEQYLFIAACLLAAAATDRRRGVSKDAGHN